MSQCEDREYYDDDVGGNFRQTKRKEGRHVLCVRDICENVVGCQNIYLSKVERNRPDVK